MFQIFKKREKKSPEDPIDFETMYIVVNELGIRGYKQEHFKTCKKIWKELVPPSGQADSLQGELLRQLEKLRGEAEDNGNINWDDNFEWFCGFIASKLKESDLFEESHMDKIEKALEYIKECGKYSALYHEGEIPDDEVDPMLFAYVDDDLYDYIADAIAVFAENNPDPIPYKGKEFIYR